MPRPGGAEGARGSFPGLPLPWAQRFLSPWEEEERGRSVPSLPPGVTGRAS